jgi:outer membrane lipoprotein
MKKGISQFCGSYPHLVFAVGMVSFVLLLIFAGCATTKKESGAEVAYEEIAFSEILKSPETYKGKIVRLGGLIVTTENREKETVLEVLEKPLSRRGRPKGEKVSEGRFMVVFEEFLDQAIYRRNRAVTVVGEVVGTKIGTIGEASYTYPLLSGRDIHLWEEGGYLHGPRMHIGVGVGGGGSRVGVGASF